jgi:hypothetical protein
MVKLWLAKQKLRKGHRIPLFLRRGKATSTETGEEAVSKDKEETHGFSLSQKEETYFQKDRKMHLNINEIYKCFD